MTPPASQETAHGGPIVILCHYFWPEEMATAEMVAGVAFELSRQGFPMAAIAGQPAYRQTEKRLPAVMEKDGVVVRRVWSTQFDKNRAIGRVLNTATFAVTSFLACLTQKNPGGFMAVTNPPLLPWVAALAGKLRRRPYFVLIHDVYPHIAVALGKIRSGSLVDRLWNALNRWAYRGAEKVLVLGECMAEVIREDLPPLQAGKVVVIPNWADGNLIRPMRPEENPLLRSLEIEGKFVVQYSGNIGLFHEIATIAQAAERLKENENIHFLIIGDGGQLPWLRQFVKERDLRNVTLLPFQPKEKLPLTLTACHVGLVALKEESTGFCVPSKLYGVLAAGKAVLAIMNSRSEIARTVQRHGCGMVIPPGAGDTLASAILALEQDRYKTEQLGQAARAAFVNHYSLERTARSYRESLRMLQ